MVQLRVWTTLFSEAEQTFLAPHRGATCIDSPLRYTPYKGQGPTGSGIFPVLSVLREIQAGEDSHNVTLTHTRRKDSRYSN